MYREVNSRSESLFNCRADNTTAPFLSRLQEDFLFHCHGYKPIFGTRELGTVDGNDNWKVCSVMEPLMQLPLFGLKQREVCFIS